MHNDKRPLQILPRRMRRAISPSLRFGFLAFSRHGNNNPTLPFQTELTAFPPPLFYSSFSLRAVSSTRSYSHPHSSLLSSFFFFGGGGGLLDTDGGRRGKKQGESVSESDTKRGREKGQRTTDRRGGGVNMRESFLSCLSAPASRPVIQSISQTEAVFFPPPLDVLYLAAVLFQLGINP